MKVSLKYAPVAENAHRFVEDMVGAARDISQVTLDHSVGSLDTVDGIVEGMRRDGPPLEAVAATLFGFGMYVGEVLVRAAGGRWVDVDTPQREAFGHPLGVEMADGRIWNPIGWVFQRFTGENQQSLRSCCLHAAGER